jgi:uncharacterized membrane protein
MKKLFIYWMAMILSCAFVTWAWVLKPQNMHVTPTDDGNAMDVNTVWTNSGQQDAFVNVVKSAVNRVLWILALITLLILLYGGFLMVTAAWNDDQYNKWFTILKQAAFGLVMIGVAWFIVSIIFWVVNLFTTTSEGSTAWTDQ